eukprot:951391-Prorocentrum_minimum.AAC.3
MLVHAHHARSLLGRHDVSDPIVSDPMTCSVIPCMRARITSHHVLSKTLYVRTPASAQNMSAKNPGESRILQWRKDLLRAQRTVLVPCEPQARARESLDSAPLPPLSRPGQPRLPSSDDVAHTWRLAGPAAEPAGHPPLRAGRAPGAPLRHRASADGAHTWQELCASMAPRLSPLATCLFGRFGPRAPPYVVALTPKAGSSSVRAAGWESAVTPPPIVQKSTQKKFKCPENI